MHTATEAQATTVAAQSASAAQYTEPVYNAEYDKELTSISVRPRVCHRLDSFVSVRQPNSLIIELVSINALASSSISSGEISTLCHKVRDDSMNGRALVSVSLTAITSTETLRPAALDGPTGDY